MAFKRSQLRQIVGDALTDEQIKQVMDAVHEEVDSLKDQLDEAKGNKDAEVWKTKFEDEHKAFEDYKADQTKRETKGKKEAALKALLASDESTLSEKGQAKALRYADKDSIELNADGTIKNAKKLLESLTEEWSEYVTEQDTHGTETKGKDGAGKKGGSAKTKEEILAMTDPIERQKTMIDNHELFGF